MRSVNDGTRDVPDDMQVGEYLLQALDAAWQLDTEYLGNRPDMVRSWELQNEIRRSMALVEIPTTDLELACEHLSAPSGWRRV